MLQHTSNRTVICIATFVACFLGWRANAGAYSFYHDNPQSYSSGNCGCASANLGDNWYNVRYALNQMGWTGPRYWGVTPGLLTSWSRPREVTTT